MKKIILLSGHICSRKTQAARALQEKFDFEIISTSNFLKEEAKKRGLDCSRQTLQKLGDDLDEETDGAWVIDYVKSEFVKRNPSRVIIDAVRRQKQIEHIRDSNLGRVIHIHLQAHEKVRRKRFNKRPESKKVVSFHDASINLTEQQIDKLRNEADLYLNTTNYEDDDILIRIAAKAGLFSPPRKRCVDILIGGQYGSEGKGQISAYLSKEYDFLVRVGGPNAGHSVLSPSGKFVYHHLPSGCKETNAKVIIGPGAVVYVPDLLKEIKNCGRTPENLFIDPNVMTISDEDRKKEDKLVKNIGSTGRGVGMATARKIMERDPENKSLAKENPDLEKFIKRTRYILETAYLKNAKIFLEGTQGSALSIHHGPYPHVTSRDTNVAGCLAEAGISPNRVNRVIMVVRSYPIRVANPDEKGKTSGFMKNEIDLKIISERSGLDLKELKKCEKTSTTNRPRRIAEFDWKQFRAACALNAPTDLVLTFADYLNKENRKARRFENLTPKTQYFISELESVAQAPVSLINTRFNKRSVIDRRNWSY